MTDLNKLLFLNIFSVRLVLRKPASGRGEVGAVVRDLGSVEEVVVGVPVDGPAVDVPPVVASCAALPTIPQISSVVKSKLNLFR